MTTSKPDLSPGWVDRLPRTVVEQDDSAARCQRKRRALSELRASRLRGANKQGKRALPEVRFVEDEVE